MFEVFILFPQIQRQIAQGYNIIWNCKAVDKLCYCMEDIFSHGLKEGLVYNINYFNSRHSFVVLNTLSFLNSPFVVYMGVQWFCGYDKCIRLQV